jgi:hypothetical protein
VRRVVGAEHVDDPHFDATPETRLLGGVAVTGWPVGTVIRGRRVMWDGSLVAPGQGEAIRFLEALPTG